MSSELLNQQASHSPRVELSTRRPLTQRALDAIFGYDFFISYTRRDGGKKYALALARSLEKEGFQVFFDSDDYAMGDDWKTMGKWALHRTSQLVLVASTEALSSSAVVREVEIYSTLRGKRIIPIDFGGTIRNRDETKPIFQHLRPEILFIEEIPQSLGIGPSDFVIQKIREGFRIRRQDKKRSRILAVTALILVILTLCASAAAAVAYRKQHEAVLARDSAQTALAKSFSRTIGQSTNELTPIENDALWELAELTEDNDPVRAKIRQSWFAPAGDFVPALMRDQAGLRALVGVSTKLFDCDHLTGEIVAALVNQKETDGSRLDSLATALNVLAVRLDAKAAASYSDRVADALENENETDPYRLRSLAAAFGSLAPRLHLDKAASHADRAVKRLNSKTETNWQRCRNLPKVLDSVIAKFDTVTAARIALQLVDILKKEKETADENETIDQHSQRRLRDNQLAEALKALESKLDADTALPLAERVKKLLENENNTDSQRFYKFAKVLGILAAKMDRAAAESLVLAAATRVADTLEKDQATDLDRLTLLVETLGTLLSCLDDTKAMPLFVKGTTRIAKVWENEAWENGRKLPFYDFDKMAETTNIWIARLDSPATAFLAERVVGVLENDKETATRRLELLTGALSILITKLDATTAAALAERIATALEVKESAGSNRLYRLEESLGILLSKLDDTTARPLALRGAHRAGEELKKHALKEDIDFSRLTGLAAALSVLVVKLDETSKPLLLNGMQRVLDELKKVPEPDSPRLTLLAQALDELVAKLKPTDRSPQLLKAIDLMVNKLENDKETNFNQLSDLAVINSRLMEKMPLQEARLSKLRSILACLKKVQASSPIQQIIREEEIAEGLLWLISLQPRQQEACYWGLNSVFITGVKTIGTSDAGLPKEPEQRRKVRELCEQFPAETLVDVLKWPLCGGEAQQVVLGALEKVLSKDHPGTHFDGDVWKFVDQAPALGITNLNSPPRRPSLEKAIAELEASIAKAQQ